MIEKQIEAHEACDREEILRLRTLSMRERGEMLARACESAALIYYSRLAAGLPDVRPEPWPESTWEFLAAATKESLATGVRAES